MYKELSQFNNNTTKTNLILKWVKELNKHLSKEDKCPKARESAGSCSISPGLAGTTTRRREELKRVKWQKRLVAS